MTTSLMKLAVGKQNVETNLGTISGFVIEYCFSIWITNLMNVFKHFGDNFTSHMTQPTVSQHRRKWLVNQVKDQSHQAQLNKR